MNKIKRTKIGETGIMIIYLVGIVFIINAIITTWVGIYLLLKNFVFLMTYPVPFNHVVGIITIALIVLCGCIYALKHMIDIGKWIQKEVEGLAY